MFISQANKELETARNEITRLHAERQCYEETMKKAFMRGVCALNLEAMTMFREGEEGGRRPSTPVTDNGRTFSGTVDHVTFLFPNGSRKAAASVVLPKSFSSPPPPQKKKKKERPFASYVAL